MIHEKSIRIMVVEDSLVDQKFLQRILESMGHEIVATAVSGEEAIGLALDKLPDIIIMDILLEGELSGIKAASIIRESHNIPIIFATALSDRQTLDDVNIDDLYGYLIKPYNNKQLFVAIEIARRRYEFERLLEENEIKYRTLFQESMDAIFISNNQGRFIDCNRAMVELLGYQKKDLLDNSLYNLIDDEKQKKDIENIIAEKGFIKDLEVEMYTLYEEKIYVLLTAKILKSSSSNTGMIQGFIKDITEKKEYEKKLESLNKELEQNLLELKEANRIISLSEKKYRLLVEGSNDIIFTVDEKGNFLTANNAIKKHLNYTPEQVQSMNFRDIFYQYDDSVTHKMFHSLLSQFAKDREPVSFKADLKSGYSSEPKEMHITIEFVDIEGKTEIMGKAQRVAEDALMKYFLSERQEYEIENYLYTTEEISYRITRNLPRYMDAKEVTEVRIALREILLNALEHGNLNISFEEKTNEMLKDNYFSFIQERQNDPRFRDKKIHIEYSLDAEGVTYSITDEGKGFDFKKILNIDLENMNRDMVTHGRGIAFARDIFDYFSYNEKGNQVIMKKYFATS